MLHRMRQMHPSNTHNGSPVTFNAQRGQDLRKGIKAAFLRRFLLDLGSPPPHIKLENKAYTAFYDRMALDAFAEGEMISCIGSFQMHDDGSYVVVIRCYTPDKPLKEAVKNRL